LMTYYEDLVDGVTRVMERIADRTLEIAKEIRDMDQDPDRVAKSTMLAGESTGLTKVSTWLLEEMQSANAQLRSDINND